MFQWSPDKASVFGSSAEDGFLNVWDHEKVSFYTIRYHFSHLCHGPAESLELGWEFMLHLSPSFHVLFNSFRFIKFF